MKIKSNKFLLFIIIALVAFISMWIRVGRDYKQQGESEMYLNNAMRLGHMCIIKYNSNKEK